MSSIADIIAERVSYNDVGAGKAAHMCSKCTKVIEAGQPKRNYSLGHSQLYFCMECVTEYEKGKCSD